MNVIGGDCTDRFVGHPESVDSILKIDEDTILTASSDGIIRIVSILPNKMIGILGDQEEFPIEGIRCNYNKDILGYYSHDEIVRFCDMSVFKQDDSHDDDEVMEADDEINMCVEKVEVVTNEEDMKVDENEEDSDDDDIDSDDDSDDETSDKGRKGNQSKYLTPRQKFYDGLL